MLGDIFIERYTFAIFDASRNKYATRLYNLHTCKKHFFLNIDFNLYYIIEWLVEKKACV